VTNSDVHNTYGKIQFHKILLLIVKLFEYVFIILLYRQGHNLVIVIAT